MQARRGNKDRGRWFVGAMAMLAPILGVCILVLGIRTEHYVQSIGGFLLCLFCGVIAWGLCSS